MYPFYVKISPSGGYYTLGRFFSRGGSECLGANSTESSLRVSGQDYLSQNLPNHHDAFEGLKGDASKYLVMECSAPLIVDVRRHQIHGEHHHRANNGEHGDNRDSH